MSPAPPTTATPVASHHQHHRYPSPHHPHRLHLAIISPTRKPPSPPPTSAATPPPRRVLCCWVHNTSGVFVSGFIAKTRVWICQISQEISQKRTRERMSDQEAKDLKAEAREIMPQPSTVNCKKPQSTKPNSIVLIRERRNGGSRLKQEEGSREGEELKLRVYIPPHSSTRS
ncbi:hypothetical protein Tco_1011866 [Tanacetum coccineum]